MHTIVTGSSGFMGTALCRELERRGHTVVRLNSRNCDLTHATALNSFNDRKYDKIFHLAAWTQAGDFCLYHPGEQWIINQQINTNVLSWWAAFQPQAKLISIGTSCAYDPELDLVETNYLVGTPIDSLFTYAMTKRMLYAGQLALSKQYGLKYLVLVPSTLYGPGYHTDGRQMHFIFDLIRKIIRGKTRGEEVVLWGDGYQRRELVYVDDFIDIALLLSEDRENDIVNIGAGEEFTIRRFADLICNVLGYDVRKVKFDSNRYVGAKSKCLNVQKMRAALPGYSLMPLEVGLERTIEWFLKEDLLGDPKAL